MSKSGKQCCDGAFAPALAGASVQIELALKESFGPVEYLGETIRRLSKMLGALQRDASAQATGDTHGTAALDGNAQELQELRKCMNTCIEKLQFHDRMVQHLTHVRNYLAAIATQLDETDEFRETFVLPSGGDWATLQQKLRERLTSGAQRELFDLILDADRGQADPAPANDDYAPKGSVDLF